MFRKTLLFVLLLLFIATVNAQQKPNIIPLPQKFHLTNGHFELNELTSIFTDSELLKDEAHFLQKQIE